MKRLRFSLKTLFALVTVLGIVCGWFAIKIGEARHQKKVVDEIRAMGAMVTYDWDVRSASVLGQSLIDILGIDFCSNVVEVSVSRVKFDVSRLEELIPWLRELPRLEDLDLAFTNISDEQLKELVPLQGLKHISFVGTHVRGSQAFKDLQGAMPNTRFIVK